MGCWADDAAAADRPVSGPSAIASAGGAARVVGRIVVVLCLGFVLTLAFGVSAGSAGVSEDPGVDISGSDFYVSPNGSDSNPGTSPDAPWKSLAKVNAAPLLPGDRVHLESGAVFTEPLAPYAGMAGTRPMRRSSSTHMATDGRPWLPASI